MEVIPITSTSTRTELETMLRSCMFVSLHCPLTPHTRGLISAAELAMMPQGSMIINYARGEVIDKQVLYAHLHCSGNTTCALFQTGGFDAWHVSDSVSPQ